MALSIWITIVSKQYISNEELKFQLKWGYLSHTDKSINGCNAFYLWIISQYESFIVPIGKPINWRDTKIPFIYAPTQTKPETFLYLHRQNILLNEIAFFFHTNKNIRENEIIKY